MILNCPKCKYEIPKKAINLTEGIAQCNQCNELFRIADYLRDDEEIRRISKPFYSKIIIDSVFNSNSIEIPPIGWAGPTFFFLIFSIIWNGVSWSGFLSAPDSSAHLFLIPFLIIGILTAAIFFLYLKGRTVVYYDKEKISVTWDVLGLKYTKSRISKDLDKITEDVIYKKNYQPVYGIGLFFKTQKKIKFGSGLKAEERKWLIGELYEMKRKYTIK